MIIQLNQSHRNWSENVKLNGEDIIIQRLKELTYTLQGESTLKVFAWSGLAKIHHFIDSVTFCVSPSHFCPSFFCYPITASNVYAHAMATVFSRAASIASYLTVDRKTRGVSFLIHRKGYNACLLMSSPCGRTVCEGVHTHTRTHTHTQSESHY